MSESNRFRVSVEALEAGVRVPRDQQVEEQATGGIPEYLTPEERDQQRLLADPAGAGTLNPRR